jgi:hypothetical protein
MVCITFFNSFFQLYILDVIFSVLVNEFYTISRYTWTKGNENFYENKKNQ